MNIQDEKVITVSDEDKIDKKGKNIEVPPTTATQLTYADIVRLGKPCEHTNAENKNRVHMNITH